MEMICPPFWIRCKWCIVHVHFLGQEGELHIHTHKIRYIFKTWQKQKIMRLPNNDTDDIRMGLVYVQEGRKKTSRHLFYTLVQQWTATATTTITTARQRIAPLFFCSLHIFTSNISFLSLSLFLSLSCSFISSLVPLYNGIHRQIKDTIWFTSSKSIHQKKRSTIWFWIQGQGLLSSYIQRWCLFNWGQLAILLSQIFLLFT